MNADKTGMLICVHRRSSAAEFSLAHPQDQIRRISARTALNSSASADDHVPMKSSKSEFRAGLGSDACSNRSVALLRLIPSQRLVSRIAFSTSAGRFLREIVIDPM